MQNRTAYCLLFLLAGIWSISFLLIKISIATIAPFTLTAVRMLIAALLLGGWLLVTRRGLPLHRRALWLYCVVGLLGNVLPFTLIGWGEIFISSSLTAISMGIMPITTALLAHIFVPSEPMRFGKFCGIAVGFCGLLTLFGTAAFAGLGAHILAQLAVLGAAICYGISSVFVRTQPAFDATQMAFGVVAGGVMMSVPLAFYMENPLQMQPAAAAIYAVVFLGVFATATAMLLYFRVLRDLGAVAFSQLNYLVPVLGSIWGVWLLGETLQPRALIALLLVLLGIYLVRPREAKK